jgi:hypothetical protein
VLMAGSTPAASTTNYLIINGLQTKNTESLQVSKFDKVTLSPQLPSDSLYTGLSHL